LSRGHNKRVFTESITFPFISEIYLELRSRAVKGSPMFSNSEVEGDPNSPFHTSTFTSDQSAQIVQSDLAITQREREIADIAKNIADIADLFKDMQTMVIDQGTLLDRIDYNIQETEQNVHKANEELDKGLEHQASARKKQLIFLLILAVLALIIMLSLKNRS
jgi:syntaxin 16